MAELKVVEIDRWEVSRLLRHLIHDRHSMRRICVIAEDDEGITHCYSNMSAVDRVWYFEAHKNRMIRGEYTKPKPPGA